MYCFRRCKAVAFGDLDTSDLLDPETCLTSSGDADTTTAFVVASGEAVAWWGGKSLLLAAAGGPASSS